MALYEHIFLARQDISSQQVDELVATYKGIIEAHGGSVGRIENWGLRSLTYRMNKNRKAYYSLMDITAPSAAIAEMERQTEAALTPKPAATELVAIRPVPSSESLYISFR